jgi:hypothetical protein
MIMVPRELFYYVGEKPPPLPCRYETNEGVLIASIAGATLTANCKLDGGTAFDVTCTNVGDGTFTINWNTTTSSFVAKGSLRVDVKVVSGAYTWYMPRFSIPIKER